jgi:RNA polymerase sigma-70 factor (ECF subfamily)
VSDTVVTIDAADDARLESLLRECAGGRKVALERLYRLTAPRVLAVLLRLIRQRAAAEDALQEVFIKVWARAGQYSPERGRPLAWMTTIARYHAIDVLRAGREHVALDDAPLAALSIEGGRPGESTRTRQRLQGCLERLSEDQRQCLRLAYENGLTHDEIAATVVKPLGSVKSWIRRALSSLKECLQP